MNVCKCGCGNETKVVKFDRSDRGLKKGQYREYLKFHVRRNSFVDSLDKSPKYCLCGCGKMTNLCKQTNSSKSCYKGVYHNYIAGHQRIGKVHSLETRKKISLLQKGRESPKKGKKYSCKIVTRLAMSSDEFREMRSRKMHDLWLNPDYRKKVSKSHIGHVVKEETKRKIGIISRDRWLNFEYRRKMYESRIGQKRGEDFKEKMRFMRLKQVFPQKDSKLELKVQELLTFNKMSFEKHKPILGQPDIFIEPNICVFVDGCYWHNCENCFDKNKFNGKQRVQVVRDQFVTQGLVNQGYVVLRFWEHEINADLGFVFGRIIGVVNG